MAGLLLDDPGQGGLAGTRRPPEDAGAVGIGFDHAAEQGVRLQEFLLAENVGQVPVAWPFRQGDIKGHVFRAGYG